MSGPNPKPGGRRQRRNKPGGRGRGMQLRPRLVAAEVPRCPQYWLIETRNQWVRYWMSDVARVADIDTDAAALTRLFTLYDERERSYRAYRKKRVVKGSTGQPTVNPVWRHAAKLDAEIRSLEDRFGVTPQARLRLGIQLGEAMKNIEDMNADLNEDDDQDHDDDQLPDARLSLAR